jgi:hypothetical protein
MNTLRTCWILLVLGCAVMADGQFPAVAEVNTKVAELLKDGAVCWEVLAFGGMGLGDYRPTGDIRTGPAWLDVIDIPGKGAYIHHAFGGPELVVPLSSRADGTLGAHNLLRRVRCPETEVGSVFGTTHFGVSVGGAFVPNLPTGSSSGFYAGGLETTAFGGMIGGSAFVDMARFGTSTGWFGSSVLSAGVVIDYIGGAQINWHGTCGSSLCDGNGSLGELNVIGEIKATTPIMPGYTGNVYAGAGFSTVWPKGTPTGAGGPAFTGSGTAPAIRVGWGFDHQVTDSVSIGAKFGYQHVFSNEFSTTLPDEHFQLKSEDKFIAAMTMTFTPTPPLTASDVAGRVQRNFVP